MNSAKPNPMIGAAKPRVDGPKKLSGQARYAADNPKADMVYGYAVFSTIASGTIAEINTREAKKMSGVIDIYHHQNFPSLYHSPSSMKQKNKVDEIRLPFEDNRVYYPGQFVAYVVADTFENARAAAFHVKVRYQPDTPIANLKQALANGETPSTHKGSKHKRGDPDAAYTNAPLQLEAVYTTPMETHNPMEMHATTAMWEGNDLILYESTQGVIFARNTMAKIFGLAPESVDVRAPFIGSGFGSKLWIWPHAVATAAIAREIGRPLQFMVPRAQMFTTTGHRPATRQTLRLGADNRGRLLSLAHRTVNTTSMLDTVVELTGRCSSSLYACDNVSVKHQTVPANTGTPTAMRAPGAAPGLFALESAMDEMAEKVGMDPIEFRKANYTDRDQSIDAPFSSIHLMEAFDEGAKAFGWSQRKPAVGAMRDGNDILGWGMAACNWEALKVACSARVSLRADGSVFASCATQDIGTGTYTVIAQTVAAELDIPIERVEVHIGDSSLPSGALSGGSWATASIMPAVAKAAQDAVSELKNIAVKKSGAFANAKVDALTFKSGKLVGPNNRSLPFADVLNAMKLANADGFAEHSGSTKDGYSYKSFGAHFVEVRWDPGISRLRISRVVSAIDGGRIVNQKTATNQVEGAIVMAIGMALFEATEYDTDSGLPVNNDIAEYLMPVHADYPPEMEVIFLDYPDTTFSEFGVRGIGEIGITGLAGAIANAVYHATGKRIRDLPIRIEDLMVT